MSSPLFLATRAVVNAEDPIGFVEMDAPEDEYDPEVRDLVKYRPPTDMAVRIAEGIYAARARLRPDDEQVPVHALAAPPAKRRNTGGGRPACAWHEGNVFLLRW